MALDFFPNPPRGCSCFYGYGALAPLLKECNLLGVIRAHQCKEEVQRCLFNMQDHNDCYVEVFFLIKGIHYCYTDNREQLYPFPLVTTVFSASNYCGTYTNKAAVMIFLPDDIQVLH